MFEHRSADRVVATSFAQYGAGVDHLWSFLRSALTSVFLQDCSTPQSENDLANAKRDFQLSPPEKESPAITNGPIHKLPPEILSEIFTWCIPTDAYNCSDVKSAPLLLVRVCRTWKRIARTTPQLWAKLGLHGLRGVHPAVLISTWLHRSGALPLDVYISPLTWNYPLNLDPYRNYIIPNAIELLTAEFHRVRTFHTTNFSGVLHGIFSEEGYIHAPLLRDFRITSSPKSSEQALAGKIFAPNLTSLEVCDPHSTLQAIIPNYQKLLVLRWNGSNPSQSWHASLDHLAPLLQSCPNLEECEIIRPRPFEDFLSPRTVISLPRLRRLSLLWKEPVDIANFLNLLELPALESLRLEMERTTSRRADLQHVLGALFPPHKPLPPLKELCAIHLDTIISGDNPPPDAFNSSLKFTALECLKLEDCSVHSAFLIALTPEPDAPPSSWSLPKLSELHMSRADLDGPRLVRMVSRRSRCPSEDESFKGRPLEPSPFKVLSLSDCGGVSIWDNAMLRGLANRGGLNISGVGCPDACELMSYP